MKPLTVFALSLTAFTASSFGQKLSAGDAKLADAARAHYYNLQASGFVSMSCSVDFDLATVPLLPSTGDDPLRRVVEHTEFTSETA